MNPNREHLDALVERFKYWLHIEDPGPIWTLAATKVSHHMGGDPIWLMLVGPSSGGKTEYLRAFQQGEEIGLDDLTPKTFISGYLKKDDDQPDLAERLKNQIWYIFDLSILMSKRHEYRAEILSDMRLIYDGKLTKEFGNRMRTEVDTSNNTLICASTPAIDNTLLEDQALGTRYVQYRLPKTNRMEVMQQIYNNRENMSVMRSSLTVQVSRFEKDFQKLEVEINEIECRNLQKMCNFATLLRTHISTDKSGEAINVASPEDPGRFFKQILKLYRAYKMIGLTEEEALVQIKKVCVDNINPVRVLFLRTLHNNTQRDDYGMRTEFTTSELHSLTGMGKKAVKMHMHALNLLGVVGFRLTNNDMYRREEERWKLLDSNLRMIMENGIKEKAGKSLYRIARRHLSLT